MKFYKFGWGLLIFFFGTVYSQQKADSTEYIVGWQLATGGMEQDFSALAKYDYLLHRPQDFSFQYLNPSIFIGNPKKYFFALFIGTSLGKEKTGTYDNYNIRAGGSSSFMGGEIKIPIKINFDAKCLQGIYLSAGAEYVYASIYSKAQGINPLMHDTSFYYESSKAKTILAKTEILFEFFNLSKQTSKFRCPVALKIGYNFQLQRPQWSGKYYRIAGDENPKINLGGFYFGLGVDWWITKDFWKGKKK